MDGQAGVEKANFNKKQSMKFWKWSNSVSSDNQELILDGPIAGVPGEATSHIDLFAKNSSNMRAI